MFATIDDNKVQDVISSYQHTEQTIIEGSDEHLDLILDLRGDLVEITRLTKKLVDEIETNFNEFNEDSAKDAVVKVFPIFRKAFQISESIKRKSLLKDALKDPLADFNREVDELKEFVSDLSRYKVQKNDELIKLFNEEI